MESQKTLLLSNLAESIENKRDDLIALTQDLVKIPTLNPPGENYLEICEYLKTRLRKSDFNIELIRANGSPGDSDKFPRWNIIGRREGSGKGDCVHFNSHTDVVDVGSGWSFDPFGAEIHDGRIYGRGTCDMKGGLASSIIACEAFLELCPNFNGAIEISGTADEETGGYGGVAHLAEKGYFSPNRVQHVIIPEPLNKDRICLGHRGGWWAEIETLGKIAHGCMPFLGDCAVRHMGAVLEEFEKNLYPKLQNRKTEMPVVPEGARHSTMNINSIHGGQIEPDPDTDALPSHCVPDSCRIIIDRRYIIEETAESVKEEVESLLNKVKGERDSFEYKIKELNRVIPSMTNRDAPIVRSVSKSIKNVLDKEPNYVASPGSYDQKHIDRIGTLKNCIAYGPGILELAHQPDEYIEIEDMIDSTKIMGNTLIDLLIS